MSKNYLNADLHCHSVVSDGTLTPEALAQRAAANGVDLWSLTDHDEIGGQRQAAQAAHAQGMAYACRHFGVHGTIFMPVTTPQQKILKTRTFGGDAIAIELTGD